MAGSLDQQLPVGPPFVPEVVPEPASPEAARPPAPHSAPGKTAAIPRLPVRLREIVVLVLLVVVADLTIYRGQGFAGYALLFVAGPVLLLVGTPCRRWNVALWIVGAMMLLLAAKLAWCGSWLQVVAGFALLAAFALAVTGLCPYVFDVAAYAVQVFPAGAVGLEDYRRAAGRYRWPIALAVVLSVVVPLAAVLGFGTLFVLANPDLATSFSTTLARLLDQFLEWTACLNLAWEEVLFWGAAAWIAVGLLRPVMREPLLAGVWAAVGGSGGMAVASTPGDERAPVESPFFATARNTLLAVIVLFAVYLGFEFQSLWFREFPKGFHYSGYAHQGAAWLTVALALSTAVLSATFRGRVLRDVRLPGLKRLAWFWSIENMVLAVAVYHRLFIYVGFNGMTRMRVVGLLGMTAVVAGFIVVVCKIARGRDFAWVVQRHLWTVAVAAYLYAVTPVDLLVHRYNVARIMSGDPAPSVQISVHPISAEGVLALPPLAGCEDAIIRDGVCALLAERALAAESKAARRADEGWTAAQLADRLLLERLDEVRGEWEVYRDPAKRRAALARFHEYAYQWF